MLLTREEQLNTINEIKNFYSKFLDPSFDANVFLECKDNFTPNSHIESTKIFEMDNPPSNPKFTIAIPTYNRYQTLKKAIDSALTQETNECYEIIVVENTDNFSERTKAQEMLEQEYRGKLTYYKNRKNLGMHGNHNRCLTLAKGEWVCILHSDDTITPDYIEEVRKVLETTADRYPILLGCLESNMKIQANCPLIEDCSNHKPFINMSPNAVLHHRNQTISIGGYNPDEYPIADTFFFCRAQSRGRVMILNKKLQDKSKHLSEYFHPKTLLAYCYIGTSFVLKFSNPKWKNRLKAYLYVKTYQKLLQDQKIIYLFIQKSIIPRLHINFFDRILLILHSLKIKISTKKRAK